MTIKELIELIESNSDYVLYYYLGFIVLTFFMNLMITPNSFDSFGKYIYSFAIYAVTIPGILATLLVLYNIFVLKTNLLNLSIMPYFAPIIGMIISLIILGSKVPMKLIPGFGRLSGLMVLIFVTFIILSIFSRMWFGTIFFGSFYQLIGMFLVLFVILRIAYLKITNSF